MTQLDHDKGIRFHHDSFEFNDGTKPPHDFDIKRRLKEYSKVRKLVYLERDPRDVMVSLYYQVTGRFKDFFHYEEDISSFIRDEYFGAGNLMRFRDIWATLCDRFDFLTVFYEDCHEDMETVIRKILTYYDFEIDPDALGKAIMDARFENMKKVEESESFEHPWLRPRNQSPKVRRGKIGGYTDELSADDIAYLNDIFGL
ncbi:MAG: sulfotransferase domain-containing protein [Deltaproteobacteria bacterium]|nr:sulfotransferase domain-containing protein [Candidatus Zymogenaceae bacterium]